MSINAKNDFGRASSNNVVADRLSDGEKKFARRTGNAAVPCALDGCENMAVHRPEGRQPCRSCRHRGTSHSISDASAKGQREQDNVVRLSSGTSNLQQGLQHQRHSTPHRLLSDQSLPREKSSQNQSIGLADDERAELREFLEETNGNFNICTAPLGRKRKRKSGYRWQSGTPLFDESLAVVFKVSPGHEWGMLERREDFQVDQKKISKGQCILVRNDDMEGSIIDVASQWKAKVLGVRALDAEHTYIRVCWLNRPEDLDHGREDHHGLHELIPTNQMDIIDARTVNDDFTLRHWDENDDEGCLPAANEFFWRQTFNTITKTFSALRPICIEKQPHNPAELIMQCSRGHCGKRMHVRCVAKKALERAAHKPRKATKLKTSVNKPKCTAVAVAKNEQIKVEVFPKDGLDDTGVVHIERDYIIIITTKDHQHYREDVQCLFCETNIDKVA